MKTTPFLASAAAMVATALSAFAQPNPAYIWSTLAGSPQGGFADGIGSAAQFSIPGSVALDSAGNVYVADTGNEVVRKVTRDGIVTTFAGSPRAIGSADGTGGSARFSSPAAVAVDANGNVFVGDGDNSTIRKITPAGVVTTVAGLAGSTGSADGVGAAARFIYPGGLAFDAQGNLYISDDGNETIRKMTPDGAVSTLAGQVGSFGLSDGQGTAALFNGPAGLAVDSAGNIYVADSGNSAIRIITPAGSVSTLAGPSGFNHPFGVAVDAGGYVYVAGYDSQTILQIAPGGAVTTIGGLDGQSGNVDGSVSSSRFDLPEGIAVDANGELFVADQLNGEIRVFGAPLPPPPPPSVPAIVLQPTPQTVAAGGAATFSVVATGTAPLTYQWTFNGAPIVGATQANLSLTNVQPAAAGNYAVEVTNPAGSALSLPAFLTVTAANPLPASLVVFDSNFNDPTRSSEFLPADVAWFLSSTSQSLVSGGGVLNWVVNNASSNFTGYLPTPINLLPGDQLALSYDFSVSVPFGTAATSLRSALLYTNGSTPVTRDTGASGVYNGYGVFTNGSATVNGMQIQRRVPGSTASNVISTSSVWNSLGAAAGNTAFAPATSYTGSLAVANTGSSTSITSGFSGGSLGGGIPATAIDLSPYTTFDTISFGIPSGDLNGSVRFTRIELDYIPNPNGPALFAMQPIASQLASVGGQVSITALASGGPNNGYRWKLNGLPITDGPGISGSGTQTLQLTNLQATEFGTYTLTVSNGFGSVTSIPSLLALAAPPVIVTSTPFQSAPVGGSATFSVVAAGAPPLTYQWFGPNGRLTNGALPDGSAIAGSATANLTISNIQSDENGNVYFASVTNPFGGNGTQPATLIVTPSFTPPVITAQPGPVIANAGFAVSFSVTAGGVPAPTYQWQLNGVNLPGATAPVLNLPSVQAGDAGMYQVLVSNPAGSVSSNAVALTVIEPLVVTSPSTANGTVGLSFQYPFVVAGGLPAFSYALTGGSLPPGVSLDPAAGTIGGVPTAAGAFDPTVTVTDAFGDSTSFNLTIAIAQAAQPPVSISPLVSSVTAGASITFTVSGGLGIGPYIWGGAATAAGPGSTLAVRFATPGNYTVTVFRGPDGAYLASNVASATITVRPKAPVLTWSQPAGITYGTPLSAAQLNATASVPGTFTYRPDLGAILKVGNAQVLTATFTPIDPADFGTGSTVTTAITVTPTTSAPIISVPSNLAAVAAGPAGASATYSASATDALGISLFSDDFESPAIPTGSYDAVTTVGSQPVTFGNWVFSSTAGVINGPNGDWGGTAPYSGNQYIWLQDENFLGVGLGSIQSAQSFDLVAGQTYTVWWAQAGRTNNGSALTYAVSIVGAQGATQVFSRTTQQGEGWQLYAASFVAASSGPVNLQFATISPGNVDNSIFLDAISLTTTGPVPADLNPASGSTFPLGTSTVTASATNIAGTMANATFQVIVTEPVTFTVIPASLTYSGQAQGPVIAASDPNATFTLTGTTSATAAGTYSVTASASGNYTGTSGSVAWSIGKAMPAISLTPYTVTYDGALHTALGAATGVLGEPLTGLSLGGTTHANAGTYTDSWSYSDSTGNYLSPTGSVTDTINQASTTITVTGYAVPFDGTAHTASGLATSVGSTVPTADLTLSGTTHTNAGTYTDTWTFADPSKNYASATGTVKDTIAQANAAIQVTAYSVTYDGKAHVATGTATGLSGGLSGLNLTGTSHTTAGTYPDTWTFTDATGNYANVTGTILDAIAKAQATIAVVPYSVTYDGNAHTATGSVTGLGGAALTGLDLSGTTHAEPGTYPDAWTFTDPTGDYQSVSGTIADQIGITALIRQGLTLSGDIDGSVQILTGSNDTLNGNVMISGDLLVPGTPTVIQNGKVTYAGTVDLAGAAAPAGYNVILNGNVVLRHVYRRVNPVAMPTVSAPPSPKGTQSVTINSSGQAAPNWTTANNVTLNGNVGSVAMPAGTYGTVIVNGNSTLVLGSAGATTASVYNLQGLTVNGNGTLQIVGPVVIDCASTVTANGNCGVKAHPEWLTVNVSGGGLTLNGNVLFSGSVVAPTPGKGAVIVNGNSTLDGTVTADSLVINGNGLLNQTP